VTSFGVCIQLSAIVHVRKGAAGLTATPGLRDGNDPVTKMQLGAARFIHEALAADSDLTHRLFT
jgi:hypothetical protein